MNRKKVFKVSLLALGVSVILLLGINRFEQALAQTGNGYDLTWFTVDGGGDKTSGGNYSLTGTVGQPDVNQYVLAGGNYVLSGGFWGHVSPGQGGGGNDVFLPIVIKIQ